MIKDIAVCVEEIVFVLSKFRAQQFEDLSTYQLLLSTQYHSIRVIVTDISQRLVDHLQGDCSRRVLDVGVLLITDLIVVQVFSNILVKGRVPVVYDHEVIGVFLREDRV